MKIITNRSLLCNVVSLADRHPTQEHVLPLWFLPQVLNDDISSHAESYTDETTVWKLLSHVVYHYTILLRVSYLTQ